MPPRTASTRNEVTQQSDAAASHPPAYTWAYVLQGQPVHPPARLILNKNRPSTPVDMSTPRKKRPCGHVAMVHLERSDRVAQAESQRKAYMSDYLGWLCHAPRTPLFALGRNSTDHLVVAGRKLVVSFDIQALCTLLHAGCIWPSEIFLGQVPAGTRKLGLRLRCWLETVSRDVAARKLLTKAVDLCLRDGVAS